MLGSLRKVPIDLPVQIQLENLYDNAKDQCKLFGPNKKAIKAAQADFVHFLNENANKVADPDKTGPLTFQGLRNTCAVNWYRGFLKRGYSPNDARCLVTEYMGWGGDWYVGSEN